MKGLIPRLKHNAPTILSILGAIGVIGTAVSSAVATVDAQKRLDQAKKEKKQELTKKEMIFEAAPAYVPTVIAGVSTIACILSANTLNRRQQAALTSAYALVHSSYTDYRKKLIELHGKEADEEIRSSILRGNCDYHVVGLDIPDDKMEYMEPVTGQCLIAYEREIMDAEYHFNRNFVLRGTANLNEFLTFLGLETTDYGEEIGWTVSDGYLWIDFEHHVVQDADGHDICIIDYVFEPMPGYLDH